MKAASAAVLIEPMDPAAIAGAGLVIGAVFLILGVTGVVSRLARALPSPHRCSACRDTGKWTTGIECPSCGGATLRPDLRENVDAP